MAIAMTTTVVVPSISSLPLFSKPHFFTFSTLPPPRFLKSAVKSSPENKDPKVSRFLDEQGVVDDMAGYLNDLSLEYDSVWDTKPSWCQPWTITLTGVLVTAASWLVLHSTPVTVVVLFLICAWWYIFLYSYPKAYADMIAERRRNVKNGMEDTFGL
ncbi:hypothetical protein QQ045_026664 [Rhodiola kirilowii]